MRGFMRSLQVVSNAGCVWNQDGVGVRILVARLINFRVMRGAGRPQVSSMHLEFLIFMRRV